VKTINFVKKISLADEILKLFPKIFLIIFIPTLLVLRFLLQVEWLFATLISVGYALILSAILIQLISKKFETCLGRLYYISTVFYEHRDALDREVIPIPVYEEMTEILENFEKSLKALKSSCSKSVKELESEYASVVDKASAMITTLEKLRAGEFAPDEFPSGLDPVGALGEALKETITEIYQRLRRARELLYELEDELKHVNLFIEGGADKDIIYPKLKNMEKIIREIKKELEFFK